MSFRCTDKTHPSPKHDSLGCKLLEDAGSHFQHPVIPYAEQTIINVGSFAT